MSVTKIMNRVRSKALPVVVGTNPLTRRGGDARTDIVGTGASAGGIGRRSYRRPFNWVLFTISVLIPLAVSVIYYGFLATDMYVSYAQMTVKTGSSSTSSSGSSGGGIAGMLASSMPGASPDSSGVVQYMMSNDIVDELQKTVNLREMWSPPEADFFSRLSQNASDEDLHRYYNRRVTATLDMTTGLISLQVEAFRPADAHRLATAIVALSDKLIDAVAERERLDMVRFAEAEVKRAHTELVRDEMAIEEFRTQHVDFNPGAAASAVGTLMATIEQELAAERAQLNSMRNRLAENSVPITTIKEKIAALEGQISKEQARLANPEGGKTYATEASEFERLTLEMSLAQSIYSTDQAALVAAEQSAAQKHLYLESYVAPNEPQACSVFTVMCASVDPNRAFMIASFLVCGLLAWGILSLLWSAVLEHAKA